MAQPISFRSAEKMETLFSCIAGYLCVFCEKFAKYLSGPKASSQMWHPCSYLDKDCASLQFISCSANGPFLLVFGKTLIFQSKALFFFSEPFCSYLFIKMLRICGTSSAPAVLYLLS